MANEAFTVDKPQAGKCETITLPEGDQAGFSFGSSEVQAMRLTEDGSLTINFTDGGLLSINNFQLLADNGVALTLADGSVINTKELFENLAGDLPVTKISDPAAGEAIGYDIQAGQKYEFDFSEHKPVEVKEQDGALLISFDNEGLIVLHNFQDAMDADVITEVAYGEQFMTLREFVDGIDLAAAMNEELEENEIPVPPQAELRDAQDANAVEPAAGDTQEQTTSMQDVSATGEEKVAALAEKLAEVEPAAGGDNGAGAASGHGYGFNSSYETTPINSLNDVGPIVRTALNYDLPEFADDVLSLNNVQQVPPPPPPVLDADSAFVYEDSSVTLAVSAAPNAGSDVYVTITISGIPAGWTVDPNGGTYNAVTGTWELSGVPGATVSGGPILTPPAQSDVDIPSLQVVATNTDTTTGLSSSSVETISVTVDAVADDPSITANNVTGSEGTSVAIDVQGFLGADTDGSESVDHYEIYGADIASYTFSAGTYLGGGAWSFTPAELSGLTITATDPHFDGTLPLVAKVFTVDTATDLDFDPSNNTNDADAPFTVTWTPDIDPPTIKVNGGVNDVQVKEDGSIDVPVVAKLGANAEPGEYLTVTITGFDPAWGTVTAPIGTFNPAGTEWTYTGPANTDISTIFTFAPGAQSDVDLTGLQATVTATDPVEGTSASVTDNFDVIVDAVADAPSIAATGGTQAEGTPIAINIAGALGADKDGSESITGYQILGIPAGFTLNNGTYDAVHNVWNLTDADLSGLEITGPAAYDGTLNLTAKVLSEETTLSGGEYDTADNINSASTPFTVTWTPDIDPPTIKVNGGVNDVQVKEDGSIDVPVVAKLSANAEPGEYLTVTITGFDPAWGTVTAPIGTFNPAGTEWTYTAPANTDISALLSFTPAANSDIDLTGLVATVTATDPAEGTSASATDNFDVIVDAVADKPDITATGGTQAEGSPIAVNIAGSLGVDTDGSEHIDHYEVSGVPAGFSFNKGTYDAVKDVWVLSPADLTGLKISGPAAYNGTLNLTATVYSTENPVSDGEYDTGDNTNSASTPFTVTWTPDIDPPTIKVNGGVNDVQVKEDGSIDVPVVAKLSANAEPGEYLTVTITGFDPAWGTVTAPIGTFNPAGTEWTYTGPANTDISTIFTFAPGAQSDVDLTGLQATVTATDPAEGTSASATDNFDVIVDAVADKPDITATGGTAVEGTPIAINIAGALGADKDGSESITGYQILGIPAGFTLNNGTYDAVHNVWNLTTADLTGLAISGPAGHDATLNLTAKVLTGETNISDSEYNTSNNTNSDTDSFTVTWTPVIHPPKITINNNISDIVVKEDGSVNVPVAVKFSANADSDEFLTVTITGFDPAWGKVTAPIGTFNPAGTVWTVTLPAGVELNTAFKFKPKADSDIDLTGLNVTAKTTDPSAGLTATDTDSFDVIVDAVADKPNLNVNGATGDEGTSIPLHITTSAADSDGSEVIQEIRISGLPTGATLSAGTQNGGVWTLSPAQLSGLKINVPDNSDGIYNLTVVSVATENPVSDGEVNYNDNTATTTKTLQLTVGEDFVPDAKLSTISVDETDFGPQVVNGNVNVDFGGDGPGTVIPQGAGSFSYSGSYQTTALRSDGQTVSVKVSGDTYIGTRAGDNKVVFTLKINTDGSYKFTAHENLDHGNPADHDDTIALKFGYKATDSDGDTAGNFIKVNWDDDGPSIEQKAGALQEDGLVNGPIGYTRTLTHDYGEDGPGSIDPTGVFMAKFQVGGPNQTLSSNGQTITVTKTTDGYIGKVGGTTIFTLNVKDNGQYTYTQYESIDHPNAANPDDVIWLKFGVEIVDGDGDTDTAFIVVDLHDSGPDAINDVRTLSTGQTQLSGNVINNDKPGADEPATVTNVRFNGTDYTVTPTGVTVVGDHGTLTIKASGVYTYVSNGPQPTAVQDLFTYTLTDADGDSDTANLTLKQTAQDDDPIFANPGTVTVDETDMSPTDDVSGTLNADFGNDGPGTYGVVGPQSFSFTGAKGGTLSSNGVPVTVTVEGTSYVGKAGGAEVFRLNLNPTTGAYKFTLKDALDHADATNPDDVIKLKFGVTATDGDGDIDTAALTINVKDDGATATMQGDVVDETGLSAGPVVVGGSMDIDYGADGAGSVTPAGEFHVTLPSDIFGADVPLNSGGVPVVVSATADGYKGVAGGVTVFTVSVDPLTGDYTFTQFEPLDHPDTTRDNDYLRLTFHMNVTDGDGDVEEVAVLRFNVHDDGPSITQHGGAIQEDGLVNGPVGYTRSMTFDYGEDGAGGIDPTGMFKAKFQVGGPDVTLSSGGKDIVVTQTTNGYVGKAGGQTVFTLSIADNGKYTYTQFNAIDHPDGSNPDDVIWLKFQVKVTDSDGDSTLGYIVVDVHDGAPVAVDDTRTIDGAQTINGNVLSNDLAGPDVPALLTDVTFNGVTKTVPAGGSITISGAYGTLVINSQGNYSYTANNNGKGTDTFTYTLSDADNDTDTATLSITASQDSVPVVKPSTVSVDETNFGPQVVNGNVGADFGTDGPGTVIPQGAGSFSYSGSYQTTALRSDGQTVSVKVSGDTYIGTRAGDNKVVFKLQINTDGSYKFTAYENLDHADPVNHDDTITLKFGYKATDSDGDTASQFITVKWDDDGPVAGNDAETVNAAVNPVLTGNVMSNDDIGTDFTLDGVVRVTFGGTTVNVPNGGSATINGQFGTLVIDSKGNYTYTANNNGEGKDVFTYTICDTDQDIDTATLSIDVGQDTVPVLTQPEIAQVDETNMAPTTSVSGLVEADFGTDGPGTFTGNGTTVTSSTPLYSNGNAVTVTRAGGTYTGSTADGDVFTLKIESDGKYTFKLLDTLDHPQGGANHNDYISINFGVKAKDSDGDVANGKITIKVYDDGLVAHDDHNIISAGSVSANGNVVTGQNGGTGAADDLSNDMPNKVTHIAFGATTVAVGAAGASIQGNFGTLKINGDGSYIYTVDTPAPTSNDVDVFKYTIADGDGDTSMANLSLCIEGQPANNPPVAKNDVYKLYELDAGGWNGKPGSSILTSGSSQRVLENGATVHQDTGSDDKGFWFRLPVLNNDSDPDGDPITITNLTFAGGHSTNIDYKIDSSGDFLIVRIGQDLNGSNSQFQLKYTIQDDHGQTDTALVTINIIDQNSPLVLDLDGDGIEMVDLYNGVLFDLGPDGSLEKTSWVGADDGLLAIDLNEDGIINDHGELFGTNTVDGFTILSAYDSNNDAVIDSADDVFGDLIVWRDSNTDGVSQAGEMLTLFDYGIESINLDASLTDQVIAGNFISHESTFNYVDGSTGTIVDAWFTSQAYNNVTGGDENDMLNGENGTDLLIGGTGDDVLAGGLGSDILYGGDDADTFLFESIDDLSVDTITDFDAQEGDVIDLSALLADTGATQETINNFVFATGSEDDTVLSIDLGGSGDAANGAEFVVLEGLTVSVEDLQSSGSIVV